MRVPPHLPDTIEVRQDLALYYDEIARLDINVGRVIGELHEQDVIDNTLVVFMSDNGRPFPRDKTTLYDGGIKTPLIASWPRVITAGGTTDSLVSAVDLAPTFLELGEARVFRQPQGQSFAEVLTDPSAVTREYAFSERHWHDYDDLVRSVRTTRYKYIRNYYPDLPNTPPADAGRSPTFQKMLQLRDQGELTADQMTPFVTPRPIEELYDLKYDPDELHNLAYDMGSKAVLDDMRTALEEWREETADFVPSVRTPDEFDRETGQPTDARIRPRPSKQEMYGSSGKY